LSRDFELAIQSFRAANICYNIRMAALDANDRDPSTKPPTGIKFLLGFRYAFWGIGHLWLEQLNIRVHAAATILVIAAGVVLRVERYDWIALVLAIGLVWTAEALNTAIEHLSDAACPDPHPLVGKAKDVGAGAVLLAAIAALVVALLVYVPYLIQWFKPTFPASP
jgi:diacylglycerol kinase (ATP)